MLKPKNIRVLISDDSETVRLLLRQLLTSEHGFEIVGEAQDGAQCVELVCRHRPEIVLLDVDMPRMDGLEATREIMRVAPTPIVIFTSSAVSVRRQVPFEALAAGALDILEKPSIQSDAGFRAMAEFLRARLKLLAPIKVIRRYPIRPLPALPDALRVPDGSTKVVAVGASTGGPSVLLKLLGSLPVATPLAILLVQHMSAEFMPGFVEWLASGLRIPVKAAVEGDHVRPGTVLVAPGDRHMMLARGRVIELDGSAPRHDCRPSVDVLFESVAQHAAPNAVGILLTGIGADGAHGLLRMRHAGCMTVAQDEASSVVFGMPKAAIEMGAAEQVLDLERIAGFLCREAGVRP